MKKPGRIRKVKFHNGRKIGCEITQIQVGFKLPKKWVHSIKTKGGKK